MTLVLCRVDDRLIHGQVIVGWGQPLGIQRIVLADDDVARSEWEQDLYRMAVPQGTECLRGYVAMRVDGTLAPELVGVLVSLAKPLADAGIPILAIGTHDTDYVLVREVDLERAVGTLRHAGHEVDTGQGITFPAKRVN